MFTRSASILVLVLVCFESYGLGLGLGLGLESYGLGHVLVLPLLVLTTSLVSSKNVSILHRCRDISTFRECVCVTACDFEKSTILSVVTGFGIILLMCATPLPLDTVCQFSLQ